MAVYVDDVRFKYRQMVMCHLWADSEDELRAMLALLGLDPHWIQRPPKASWLHYDVSLGYKAKAIKFGAIHTDRFGAAEHCAKLDIASDKPAIVARGRRTLELVINSRAVRQGPLFGIVGGGMEACG